MTVQRRRGDAFAALGLTHGNLAGVFTGREAKLSVKLVGHVVEVPATVLKAAFGYLFILRAQPVTNAANAHSNNTSTMACAESEHDTAPT